MVTINWTVTINWMVTRNDGHEEVDGHEELLWSRRIILVTKNDRLLSSAIVSYRLLSLGRITEGNDSRRKRTKKDGHEKVVTVWSRYDHGHGTVWSRSWYGTVTVWSRSRYGTVTVWSRNPVKNERSTVKIDLVMRKAICTKIKF